MENFNSKLIFQIGDLIHYQYHDYKEKTPNNASIYSLIGTILRNMGKPSIEHYTIGKLLEESDAFNHISSEELKLFNKLKKFNAVMLVDLVSRMQGGETDNLFEEQANFITQKYTAS